MVNRTLQGVHLAALFLGRTSRSAFTGDKEGLDRGMEPGFFLLRRQVLDIIRNQFGADTVFQRTQHFIGIGHGPFPEGNHLARGDIAGGLGVLPAHFHAAALAGLGRFGPGLECADGPEIFIDTDRIHLMILDTGFPAKGSLPRPVPGRMPPYPRGPEWFHRP